MHNQSKRIANIVLYESVSDYYKITLFTQNNIYLNWGAFSSPRGALEWSSLLFRLPSNHFIRKYRWIWQQVI